MDKAEKTETELNVHITVDKTNKGSCVLALRGIPETNENTPIMKLGHM